MTEKFKPEKHRVNPFTENLVITTTSKQVKVSPFGKNDNVLVNQDTGEVKGTHVVTYKQVDDTEFVKMFTGNIALAFDLTAAGTKALWITMHALQKAIQKDSVYLDEQTLEEFLEDNPSKKCSKNTLYRGITELLKAKIIAKSTRSGVYFINPSFTFNGDRVAFTTALIRKKKVDNDKQETLPLED